MQQTAGQKAEIIRWAKDSHLAYLRAEYDNMARNITADSSFPKDRMLVVATPYTRPDGDAIEVELVLPDGMESQSVMLTDMGDTMGFLFVNGITLDDATKDIARQIAAMYGVSIGPDTQVMEIILPRDDVGRAMNMMCQAIIAVSNLREHRVTVG